MLTIGFKLCCGLLSIFKIDEWLYDRLGNLFPDLQSRVNNGSAFLLSTLLISAMYLESESGLK